MNGLSHTGTPLLRREDSLLVMIDLQERLVPAMAEKEKLVENVVRLARFSRIIGLPVIVTEQQKLGSTLPEIRDFLGNPEPVPKVDFNCFGEAMFSEKIQPFRRNTIILTGIETHICVAQTALHGLSEYRVHVVGDAVSSRTLQNRDVALRRMEKEGVTITSTEMLIYELLQKAGTDEFREVLKLVK
jgi:nicotinamidase-related amidase